MKLPARSSRRMRVGRIALRNMVRHSGRSLLLVLIIAVAVGVVMTLDIVVYSAQRDLADRTDEYGPNIVVVPRADELPVSYGGVDLGKITYDTEPLHQGDAEKIRSIKNRENINRVAPKLLGEVEIEGTRVPAMGVVWEEELGVKKWWELTGATPEGPGDLVVGSRVSERLGVTAGDALSFGEREFRVVSELEPTGTQEDELIYMDLLAASRMWDRGDEVSLIEVSAWCSTCPIETITAQIKAEMPYARVSSVKKSLASREMLVGQFELFGAVLSALMVLVGALIIFTATLGGVRERRREIGVFRALGYRGRLIFRIVLTENAVLGLIGGVLGATVAVAAAGPITSSVAGVDVLWDGILIRVGAALGASLVVVTASSLYPAWKASRLSPALAMREV